MKIGIYGGTFDPPHLGHMAAAREAMLHFSLDRLFFIPNRLPPHKFLPPEAAARDDRYEMTCHMADALGADFHVLDVELRREGPSFTVDTVRRLREDYTDAEFYLLMGTDMFLRFETWQEPRSLCEEVILAPFSRGTGGSHELFAVQAEKLRDLYGARIEQLPLSEAHPISSTQVRKLLKERDTEAEGAALLWTSVYGHIIRHGLYGVSSDLKNLPVDRLRAVSHSMMQAKRIMHVLGVEESAMALARCWGEDEALARRAAILHDCTKYDTLEQQLAICARYDVPVSELERTSAKLLHAKTAAALSRHVFCEEDAVSVAVEKHTTAAGEMSTLDKILYMADYIEPNRDFPGVDALRQLAFSDLDAALLAGLETTLEELAGKGAVVHPNTEAALRTLKGSETKA